MRRIRRLNIEITVKTCRKKRDEQGETICTMNLQMVRPDIGREYAAAGDGDQLQYI